MFGLGRTEDVSALAFKTGSEALSLFEQAQAGLIQSNELHQQAAQESAQKAAELRAQIEREIADAEATAAASRSAVARNEQALKGLALILGE